MLELQSSIKNEIFPNCYIDNGLSSKQKAAKMSLEMNFRAELVVLKEIGTACMAFQLSFVFRLFRGKC